jgi:hypothetical protein
MKPITPPSKEELEILYPKNSLKIIGKMMGVSHRTVWKWCRDYGLPMLPRGGVAGRFKRPDIDTDAILTLKAQGLKPGQIAKRLKTSRAVVAYRLENYSDWKPDKDFHDKSSSLPWEEIIHKYAALKVSGETIAEEHKVSRGVIYRGLVNRGIKLRERTAHMKDLWADRKAKLAKAERVLATRGGKTPEDDRAAMTDSLYNQNLRWAAIKSQVEAKFHVHTTIKALQELRNRWLKRQKND